MAGMVEELRFRAMGSDAHVVLVAQPDGILADDMLADGMLADGMLELARARIGELERRWSRFIESSEVCELRRRAGEWVEVSDDTVRLVELAIEGWRVSGGAFDPLLLDDVERAGYDRSFESLVHDPAYATPLSARAA